MSFSEKVVLVTGASSGIGAAIAIKFAADGAKVVLVGRNEEKLKNTAKTCEREGGKPHVIIADVSKDNDVKKIVTETIDKFGQLDVLVNNAGIANSSKIDAENALQIFDKVMATNLRAAFYMTNLCVPHLTKTRGNIINISSALSSVVSLTSIYAASKAALDHFSRCIALELAPKGIRVNTVNPGPVKSDIVANLGVNEEQEAATWEMMKKTTALDRVADPEEVADIVVFLASEKARSITGSCYITDNGLCLKGAP